MKTKDIPMKLVSEGFTHSEAFTKHTQKICKDLVANMSKIQFESKSQQL
jgi:hypothetical protein